VSNGLEQQVAPITAAELIPVAAGVALFGWWLLTTSLGRKALAGAKPRRNRMTPWVPFLVFFVWLVGIGLLQAAAITFVGSLQSWQGLFAGNLAAAVGAALVVGLALLVARLTFARGVKGLGLRLRTVPKDLVYSFLNLLAVWPLVMAAMSLTVLVLRSLVGRDFEVPQHEALEIITKSPAIPLQILIVVQAVVVAPLVEEVLFRGLFQTMIRSYVGRPWPAIAMASILFAAVHFNASHWPALFVLALGLGYSYEKSNSLFRPIFMHALFNGITIAAALAESAAKG
jgi:membrane protease YdiL (CAAX protease family)